MADINSSEERSTRDHYSLTGNPLIPSLTGPVNLHPSSQYPSNTAGHSTTSTSTPNNGLGNRPRNVPSRASQAGADVGVVRHEPPVGPGWARCNICGSHFRAVARHIQDVHQKRTLIDCPKDGCSRKGYRGFRRVDNLRDHLRRVHDIPIPKMRRRKNKESE